MLVGMFLNSIMNNVVEQFFMRSGDWNVAMTSMRQAHVTSRSKSTTVSCIARTNLSKRNLKLSVVL